MEELQKPFLWKHCGWRNVLETIVSSMAETACCPVLLGVNVDDLIFTGGELLREITDLIASRSASKRIAELPFLCA